MQIITEATRDWKTMRAQFKGEETYSCVADRAFAETLRNVCFFIYLFIYFLCNTVLAFHQL